MFHRECITKQMLHLSKGTCLHSKLTVHIDFGMWFAWAIWQCFAAKHRSSQRLRKRPTRRTVFVEVTLSALGALLLSLPNCLIREVVVRPFQQIESLFCFPFWKSPTPHGRESLCPSKRLSQPILVVRQGFAVTRYQWTRPLQTSPCLRADNSVTV